MTIPILETPRLILRSFKETDLDQYAEMCADPEVMRFISTGGKVLSRAESWRNMAMVIGHWTLRGYGLWAVEEKASKLMIGRVGLWQPEGWPGLEVGWTLLKSAWGKGYATEAGKASINYGFEVLKQPSLISLIDPKNYASQKVATRLGMTMQKQIEVTGDLVLVYQINC